MSSNDQARVLVLEDDGRLQKFLSDAILTSGYHCQVDSQVPTDALLALLNWEHYALVVVGVRRFATTLLERVQTGSGVVPIILLVDQMMEGILAASGNLHQVHKPFGLGEFKAALEKAMPGSVPRREKLVPSSLFQDLPHPGACPTCAARETSSANGGGPTVFTGKGSTRLPILKRGKSNDLRAQLAKVAKSDSTVLLRGETGVGKEFWAQWIHAHSSRRNSSFVPVNCGALPPALILSELFGHVRGAFTGTTETRPGAVESARGGTLFLDEIGDLSKELQVTLNRLLENHENKALGSDNPKKSDVRIIAATNADLEKAMKEGTFRKDLYYRLNVITVEISPLRERCEEIPGLVDRFLSECAQKEGCPVPGLTAAAMEAFLRHPWEGNVRELRNVLERLVVVRGAETIDLGDLPPEFQKPKRGGAEPMAQAKGRVPITKEAVIRAFAMAGGDARRAAHTLGVAYRYIFELCKKFGIGRKE
jgi:DNA-binding NtrC family response regulator